MKGFSLLCDKAFKHISRKNKMEVHKNQHTDVNKLQNSVINSTRQPAQLDLIQAALSKTITYETTASENKQFAYAKTNMQINCANCAVTAQLISAYVFATRIVKFLYFLNPKFLACACTAPFEQTCSKTTLLMQLI